MTHFLTYYWVMMKYNLSEAKAKFSAVMEAVQAGETVVLCKRNQPVATLAPYEPKGENAGTHHTRMGWAHDTVHIHGDLTEPAISASDWDMLK